MVKQFIGLSRLLRLVRIYYAWIGLAAVILTMTTAFASNDLIRANHFHWLDITLTYSFLLAWGFIDAFLIVVAFVLVEVTLESIFRRKLEAIFKILSALVFIAAWLNVLRIIILNGVR